MIAWWIAQLALLGALLSVAALGAEAALKVARRQTRWVWIAAMGLTVILGALAPMRRDADLKAPPVVSVNTLYVDGQPAVHLDGGLLYQIRMMLLDLKSAFVSATHRAFAAWHAATPDGTDRALLLLWIAVSVMLLIAFVAVHARYRRRRAGWHSGELLGTTVRIAEDVGPAVVGLTSTEIVVPQWLLQRDVHEQRLVLEHELEHVRQRDPLLLAVAHVTVILMPWNLALWWMANRLRLAVELDCDQRVLQRGASVRAYGSLLIDLTDHRTGFGAALPAFSCTPSHLERRLIAMTPKKLRYPLVRVITAGAFASLALLAACEAKLPTDAEVNNMTAASATSAVGKVALMDTARITYYVNDIETPKAQAEAIRPDSIATINVNKTAGGTGEVRITLLKPGQARSGAYKTETDTVVVMKRGEGVNITSGSTSGAKAPFTGLLIVDGVARESSGMNAINPDDIATVNVIKGPAATAKYSDPRAANGVIEIVTKKATAKP